MPTRRVALAGLGAFAATPALARLSAGLGKGEQTAWAAYDMRTRRWSGEDPHARLPMCSTFKWLLVAHVLWRVDGGRERLDRAVAFGPADLLPNSPAVAAALTQAGSALSSLSVGALCAATMADSDNAAANLLLARTGGPAAVTAWLRAHGDEVTRLDRTEPALNDVPAGDARDTTTPAAMVENLRRFVYGPVLTPASRGRLRAWLVSCRTGPNRLAAGLPPGWRIGHRTGTRTLGPDDRPPARAAAGDVGVLLPPEGAPVLVAAYAAGWTAPLPEVERWMADIARRLATAA